MKVLAALLALFALAGPIDAAEATTGTLVGSVLTAAGRPVPSARVAAVSASGRYTAVTDARGRFTILGMAPDTYLVSTDSVGYEPAARSGVTVQPGQTQQLSFGLVPLLTKIGAVRASASSSFAVGMPSDSFTVSGAAARAQAPTASSSGLGA
jgi:hypothetical protein